MEDITKKKEEQLKSIDDKIETFKKLEMGTYNYRLDLSSSDLNSLIFVLKDCINSKNYDNMFIDNIVEKLSKELKPIKQSNKKHSAADKAREEKTKQVKEKIENGINLLRMETKKFTHYSISKSSGVSFNTVRKHITEEQLKELNKCYTDKQNEIK